MGISWMSHNRIPRGVLRAGSGAFAAGLLTLFNQSSAISGPYAPAAGQPGSTAIHHSDVRIVAWGTAVGSVVRGPYDISDPDSPTVSFGNLSAALGPANGFDPITEQPLTSPNAVVSLGDGGLLTLLFEQPIFDGPFDDFVVFENGFSDSFLELGFVEVSSDGSNFFRFPSSSLSQTQVQIDQASNTENGLDPTNLNGFAGKYRAAWGVPFDLALIGGNAGLDVNRVVAVRIVDVVGSIDPLYARRDTAGNIINDPWPTPFNTGGFDIDAVGVIHHVPEPSWATIVAGALVCTRRHRRRES
jgi:hypothetical protein